ncbi:uncharacterized protein isoform X2 [Leptinotarsa decemlineata]|uniref:uncharacterized protein isoform X2 n=1 Tax=Leptinotarsa decemlineata TaxID=7539 RepID=UPI003D30BAAF
MNRTDYVSTLLSTQYNTAGGCAQNSLRVLQWLTKKQCEATIFGSVGNDKEAVLLKKLLHDDGVETRYIVQNNLRTGKTIALIKGQSRSLVAYIGAAEKLPLEDLLANKNFHAKVKSCDLVYIEGFFLTNRTETARYILDFCNRQNLIVAFNISGEYICDLLPDTVRHCIEHSDIVFGNKREFEAIRKVMKLDSIEDLTSRLTKNGLGRIKEHGNIIVITDGPKSGTCVSRERAFKFEVPKILEHEFRDTTGAGDAFTGGFIAGFCSNKGLSECARIGCYAANQIIRQVGCSLPEFTPNILDFSNSSS